MPKVQLSDFTMAYDDVGSGKAILFIHGYPLTRKMWQPQLDELSSHLRVIAPDLRGHGESTATKGIYTMELLAGDCQALLDYLNIEKVILCGLSMGGYISLAFARRYPERLAGLILTATRAAADTTGLSMGGYISLAFARRYPERLAGLILTATRAAADTTEGKANRDRAIQEARQNGVNPIIESLIPRLLSPSTIQRNPQLIESLRQIMQAVSVDAIIGDLSGMKERPDSRAYLPEINVPTLIIHGKNDSLIPLTEVQDMNSAIPNSQLILLDNCGHLPNLEASALFNQTILDFIKSI